LKISFLLFYVKYMYSYEGGIKGNIGEG